MLLHCYSPGFAFTLALVSSCLEQWSKNTGGREEALLEFQFTLTDVLDQLLEWKQKNETMLLLNSAMEDASMSIVSINMAATRLLKLAIVHAPEYIKASHWDFILCSVIGWVQVRRSLSWTAEDGDGNVGKKVRADFLNVVYFRRGLTCTIGLTNDLIDGGQPTAKLRLRKAKPSHVLKTVFSPRLATVYHVVGWPKSTR